jgi:hypothetical protein
MTNEPESLENLFKNEDLSNADSKDSFDNLTFYVLGNGSNKKIGPLSREEILLGVENNKYDCFTYAWTPGIKDWIQLSDPFWCKMGILTEEKIQLPPPIPEHSEKVKERGQPVEEIFQHNEFLLDELNWVHAKKKDPEGNYVCYPDSAEKFTGKAVRRSRNGKILHLANFRDGLPWGEEKTWHSNGQLGENCTWERGSHGQSCYSLKSGDYILPANHKGEHTCYYENGQKMEDSFFENGKLHGSLKGWYENGKLKYDANYSNGKLNGYFTDYDENGGKKMVNSEGQTKGDSDTETAVTIGMLGSIILCPLSIFLLIHYDGTGDKSTGQFWVVVLFISLLVGVFSFAYLSSNSSGSNASTSNTYRMASMHQRQQQHREMQEMNDKMSDMM